MAKPSFIIKRHAVLDFFYNKTRKIKPILGNEITKIIFCEQNEDNK
jgi:hypothetical protein